MIFPRTVLIASAMLLAASVHAADVSMANGQVHFTTPNGWLDIMETVDDRAMAPGPVTARAAEVFAKLSADRVDP